MESYNITKFIDKDSIIQIVYLLETAGEGIVQTRLGRLDFIDDEVIVLKPHAEEDIDQSSNIAGILTVIEVKNVKEVILIKY